MNRIESIMKRKSKKKILIPLLLLLGLLAFLYQQNNMISITRISIESEQLPEAFNGYKIVHLSDLHGKAFGKKQKYLVEKIKKAKPDLIVFTGDLIDSRRYKEEASIELMKQLIPVADIYYVNGNHEAGSGNFPSLEKQLLDVGVKVLRNTAEIIEVNGEMIYIIGLDDPLFGYAIDRTFVSSEGMLDHITNGLQEDGFKILLSHRPELFHLYIENDINVTFSGHAHGGQIRLPFIGGLVAPGQGILPQYTEGVYTEGNSNLVVSRGLGNSLFPQRLFNRPEIIVVQLMK
ncbi:metallophosphoesterase [Alkaliphilus transvaalensis]|uniref:metallophosphoesterase n=1 Tax=Alkaliphilus transvaalensis TaxID=114628 RepID=UPI000A7D6CF6|nr:metallophosphoesterase [Alkaliphilus transvaalensis]